MTKNNCPEMAMDSSTSQIGTDISTMEAVQSLFGKKSDPWRVECLANWIDVTVNHEKTLFALPKALDDLPQSIVFPDILRKAQSQGLISPVSDESAADRINLD